MTERSRQGTKRRRAQVRRPADLRSIGHSAFSRPILCRPHTLNAGSSAPSPWAGEGFRIGPRKPDADKPLAVHAASPPGRAALISLARRGGRVVELSLSHERAARSRDSCDPRDRPCEVGDQAGKARSSFNSIDHPRRQPARPRNPRASGAARTTGEHDPVPGGSFRG
jgi:hypothetical protein